MPRATRQHRLFCHITQTWRGRPLVDRMAVVELIAATTTKAGLKVESALDTATYQKGIKPNFESFENNIAVHQWLAGHSEF